MNDVDYILEKLPLTLETGWTIIEKLPPQNPPKKGRIYPDLKCICPGCKREKILKFRSVFYAKSKQCAACNNALTTEKRFARRAKKNILTIRLTPEQISMIEAVSLQRHCTMSDVIRQALSDHVPDFNNKASLQLP